MFKHIIRLIPLACLMTLLSTISTWAGTVEYNDLRTLLSQNNSSLESINTNLENIQYQIDTLYSARSTLKDNAQKAKEDGDTAAAKAYEAEVKQISTNYVKLKESLEKQTNAKSSYQKSLNQLEKTAQTLMIVYSQSLYNQQAAQKNYDAAVLKYSTVLNKYSAGISNETDVLNASNNMTAMANILESSNQQLESARYSLLKTLGLTDDLTVTIGNVPDPDVNAITSIDYDTDKRYFAGQSSELKSAHNIKSYKFYKEAAETMASGNAAADYADLYNQLQAGVLEYQAQSAAYEAAKKSYETLQHKYQLGMVTKTDFAEGEASYYSALSQFKTEAMNLLQAYEDYEWALSGA